MKSLFEVEPRAEILRRLAGLRPDSPRRWGSLTPAQIVIHCLDTFDYTFGVKDTEPPKGPMQSGLARWMVIDSPLPWPRGVRTAPQFFESEPRAFDDDLAKLRACVERFSQGKSHATWGRSPMLGALTAEQWSRLQYRHLDHHLRQFGL